MENKDLPSCCSPKRKKSNGLIQGIIYGTIPHIGCIAFILFSVLGVTFAASIFKQLLAKAYFFYIMIALSFVFASLSALFYLRKNGGIKTAMNHKGYLSILYGTTIAIALIMYFIVFPMVAGVSASTGGTVSADDSQIKIKVIIPCEGHAPLITDELKKLNGVNNIQFSSPNYFTISYDNSKTNQDQILNLNIFKEYKASIVQ